MELSNGQLGVSNFQRNGMFATNCSPKPFPLSRFSIFGRPIFGIGLNEKNVKKSRVSGIKTVNRGTVINALAKEESDNRSVGCEILEKDFEFKPSFDQYLKVMGSVKLRSDKDTKKRSKEENPKHNLRSRDVSRRQLSEANEERVKLGETRGHVDREKVLKVTKIYENANGTVEQSKRQRVKGFKDEYDSRQSNMDEKENRKIRGDIRDGDWSKYTGRLERDLDFNSGKSALARNAKESPRGYKSTGKDFERRKSGVRSEDGLQMYRINAEKAADDRGFSPRSGNLTNSGRDFPRKDYDERAAFKNFDEFNEIMDKPRVSQMQMEERIQKLAKSYVLYSSFKSFLF